MTYNHSRKVRKKRRKLKIRPILFVTIVFLVLLISISKLLAFMHVHQNSQKANSNLSQLSFSIHKLKQPMKLSINWPDQGQAALMIDGRYYDQHGKNTPVPTASLAKMMTALIVLKKHPLSKEENGPSYTVTPQDVKLYEEEVKQGDSVVRVAAGESLTERQMLQALLMPSGDNVAVYLAKWISGSVPRFVDQMNAEAKRLGLKQTQYADPAGVSEQTVSTALDQIQVAYTAMHLPVFKKIVSQQKVQFPVIGTLKNTNSDLGHDGIVGIKTGNLVHIGNIALAAERSVDHKHVFVIGVVLGQYGRNPWSSLNAALEAGRNLIKSVS